MEKIDTLNIELNLIDERLRCKKGKWYRTLSHEEYTVHGAQRFMLTDPEAYPMTDILFMSECKRRSIGMCDYCNLRFRCWTEK